MMLFFSYPYAYQMLFITILCGFYIASLGIPLVLKKQAFTGIALAQAAAFGGVVGTILHIPQFILPFICVFVTLGIVIIRRAKRTADDGLVAIIFVNAAAFATLLISKMPTGEADLLIINFGNILALNQTEVWVGTVLSVVGITVYFRLYSQLLAVLNDIESAKALGYRSYLILGTYSILLATGVTFGLLIFGVIVVFAFLIAPPFIALRVSGTRIGWIVSIFLVSLIAGSAGLIFSFAFDFPPGTFIAGLLGFSSFIVWIFRK